MQRVINKILNSSKIMIFGNGIAKDIARQATFKFMSL